MLYKILKLILEEDTFSIFGTYPLDYNLSHIASNEYKTVEELENTLLLFFNNMLDLPVNSFFYNEAVRMKRFTEKIFRNLEKQSDVDIDYTDHMIDIYTDTTEEYIDVPIMGEHIDFVLK
ncbi:hypothetical protein SLOPH_1818 [Spraguea lophii 42_110]|uniref:Uncharacterized protein n=1 Tax=Spraguea lophii (strain 42_110) TaxID=1358809 RepID=S7W9F6_SPRLO|nr:hypothetical protein SLOPH_1818 [Spraguea lophii 42_110]